MPPMNARIRIEAKQHLPVPLRDGFDYITDPANRPDCWPRQVPVRSAKRWREPGDRTSLIPRTVGREIELNMTLVRIQPYKLVEYTSQQVGRPAARHWRHSAWSGDELAYRIAIEYSPETRLADPLRPAIRAPGRRGVMRKRSRT
jgi:hypothetical protein